MKMFFVLALLVVCGKTSAQDMTMFNAYNDAGISIAGTMTMNAAICNQTNSCKGISSEEKSRQRIRSSNILACKKDVIQRTQSGTTARREGYANCETKFSELPSTAVTSNGTPNDPINYRVNAAVAEQVKTLAIRAATAKASNPERVRTLIEQQDVEKLFDNLMDKHGLRSGNLVDSITAYWLTNWMVVNQSSMPDRLTVNGVRTQMMAAAHQSGYSKRDDAYKQRESEIMMWQTILLLASYQNAQMDKPSLSKEINNNTKRQGMDMSLYTVTKNGFVLR
jgi:hypothetical protein